MKTILQRKDNTSIFCPPVSKRRKTDTAIAKGTELIIAGICIITGLCILFISL
ncbi:MAG: hypothetical protein NTX92_04835 [Euryarchaeota archaeon]|nr:hypothetical protein [Euryarchaeota archaeon]